MTDQVAFVEGLQARDPRAQQRFWQVYWDKVYPICIRILGKGPDAIDVTVDLMTDFVDRHVQNLSDPRAIWSYLRLMAIRQSLEVKKKREKFAPLDFDIEDIKGESPESGAIVAKLTPRLEHCLGHLTPKAQQVLRLKYTGEMTNEEIGRRIGGSKQYIGRLLRQSLTALRKCLEKPKGDPSESKGRPMNADNKQGITDQVVENLLSARIRHRQHSHASELAQLALVVAGVADGAQKKATDQHLAGCAACREVMLTLVTHDSEEPMRPSTSHVLNDWRHLGKPLAAAAVLVLGLAIFFVAKEESEPSSPGSPMRIKGFEDDLIVAVGRGDRRFILEPMGPLQTDDRLGMFYSATREGYLMVISIDGSGQSAMLHPVGGAESAPIYAGERISLNDGAIVETGKGCEWIVAVFSDDPLDVDTVNSAVETSRISERRCGLDIHVPGSRTVKVIPITR